jgi:hypothetical protein
MNKRSIFLQLVAGLIFFGMTAGQAFSEELTGRVYDGAAGVETTPLSAVAVTLYGSNNSGSIGNVIISTTTNSSGWYSLQVRGTYEFYNIIESDPSGYNSTGATSVDGTVISSNKIQYTYPLEGKTLTGNKFYDQKPSSNNPPVADAGGPYYASVGEPIILDASGSYDPDSGDKIVQYEWFWTSNGSLVPINGAFTVPTANWVPAGPVSTYVTVKVTDSHGTTDTDTAVEVITEEEEETGAIYGKKFNDENGNHQKDSGESGLSGWEIKLEGTTTSGKTVSDVATTGSDGKYSFTGLEPGTYTVSEKHQSGWTQTYPTSPSEYTVEVAGGQAVSDINFGNMESDNPPSDTYDYGDAPSPYPEAYAVWDGVWLGAKGADHESSMLRSTDALGDDNDADDDEDGLVISSPTGNYIKGQPVFMDVTVENPAERWAVFGIWIDWKGDGSWDGDRIYSATFSEGELSLTLCPLIPNDAITGKTYIRLRAGLAISQTDASTMLPSGQCSGEIEDYAIEIREGEPSQPSGGNIYGTKYNDQNGNGIWDPSEPPLAGWEFWLDMNRNGIQDAGDQTAYSDANGHFLFSGLDYQDYVLGEVMQPGWAQTCPGGSGIYSVHLVNMAKVSAEDMIKPGYLFGNHQTENPGGGEGALKWFQPPLFDPEKFGEKCYYGWGEPAMEGNMTLADDWFCYSPRPVTSVTWWGTYTGWRSSTPPQPAPLKFRIGLWTNASVEEGESRHPDRMIREWFVDRSMLNEQADRNCQMPEWAASEADTCFRYTFSIPEPEWFRQESDSAIYWLSITSVYTEPPAGNVWGWLTRELFFNSNALRVFIPAVPHPDSLYRVGEPMPPYWDMAFVLGTDENTAVMDFGDAVDGFGTTFSHNGALHLVRHDVRLGAEIDAENDGMPGPGAQNDDSNSLDDEDGVVFLSDFVPGTLAEAAVSTSAHGFLNAWLDRNHNGLWDPGEQVINNMDLTAGNQVVRFPVPDETGPGVSALRFRFSTMPDVWAKGFAPDGEVEDYEVEISPRTGVWERHSESRPEQFRLYPNYPNPFNPSTTIRFNIPKSEHVRLSLHNLLGQEIAVLVNERCAEGIHEVKWNGLDARNLPAPTGVYLYRFEAGEYHGMGKLLLMK